MTGDTILDKKVYFMGSWKVKKLSDKLHGDIARHASNTHGLLCILSITRVGIQLVEMDGSRTLHQGLIPEKNVLEIITNRDNPYCLMCVVKDDQSKELLNIMAWRCRHQADVSDILSCFVVDKYNGTLLIKQKPPVTSQILDGKDRYKRHNTLIVDEVFYNGTGNGNRLRDIAVQTDSANFHQQNNSSNQDQELMDKIQSLQREITELRLFVQTHDVSHSQYFVRRRVTSKGSDQYEYVPLKIVDTKTSTENSRVPNHDRRSYAIQTDFRRYTAGRRTGRELVRPSGNKAHLVLKKRTRSKSEPKFQGSSSNSVSRSYMRMASDSSDVQRKVLGYVTLPPEKEENKVLWSNGVQSNALLPYSPNPLKLTVEKPIEDVYGTPRYRKQTTSAKQRKEITPYTFVGSNDRMSNGEDKPEQKKEPNGFMRSDIPLY